MNDIIDLIYRTFNDTVKVSIFSKLKTNNPIIDTILSTIVLTCMSYLVQIMHKSDIHIFFTHINQFNIRDIIQSCIYKKKQLTLEGKKYMTISPYSSKPVISVVCSDTFNAVWSSILLDMYNNPSVCEIKEFFDISDNINKLLRANNKRLDNNDDDDTRPLDKVTSKVINNSYIISQESKFMVSKELQIYAYSLMTTESSDDSRDKINTKTDKISIVLYSYITSLDNIQKYVHNITQNYISNIENKRKSQKFIYTLYKTKYDDSKYECWSEHEFESSRTFENMFFEQKHEILEHINFWINNKEWYYEMGIPYTLGFGLKGPPGTGKTSFMKSLANLLKRHLVVLSLKLIKTSRQLDDFFFEDTYNSFNSSHSIGFSNKIIFIDDIDCIGDIVKKRDNSDNTFYSSTKHPSSTQTVNLLHNLLSNIDTNDTQSVTPTPSSGTTILKTLDEDPLTLDDLLQKIDGIRETPGRIFVIASNYWHLLDDALIRPGRIDKIIHMGNVSRNTFSQMFEHFYKQPINPVALNQFTPDFYSPAEIINIYITYKDSPNTFIERILMHVKVGNEK